MKDDPVMDKINKRRAKLRQKMEWKLRATGHENSEIQENYK